MRLICAFVVVTAALATACDPTEVGPGGGGVCSGAAPCADGLVCADGSCVTACTEGSCTTGLCDTFSGLCVECRDSVDCGANRVCNTFTHLCTEPQQGCTSDGDCDGDTRCDTIKGSCVDCLDNLDCPDGSACDQLTRTCEAQQGCVNDGDCAGAVCDPDSRVCVECFVGAHCPSGQCDSVSHTCLTACDDDDDSEPNSAADGGAPAPIVSGTEHSGAICPGDVDEFAFDGAGSVDVVLTVDGGRLSVDLLNGAGTVVTSGTAGLSASDLPQGSYKLVVRGLDDAVEGDYLLRLTVVEPTVCEELDAEDNDSSGTALTLPTDGSLRGGSICGADVDFWKFTVAQGDDVVVSVVPGDGAGVVTADVMSGATVIDTAGDGNDAAVDNAAAGTLFVRVQSRGGDVGYSLRVTTSSAPPVCVQRDAEPNNTDAEARPLTEATQNGQICAGDVDQWRFTTNDLDDITVTLSGSNVRARLFDAGGAVVGEGTTTFTAVDVDAGVHRIEVKGTSGTVEAAYTVTIAIAPEPLPDVCDEGGLEPDSRTDARPLTTDGSPASGRICAGESDFFAFTVPAGAAKDVAVSVRFEHDDGDIDVRLLDSTGALVTDSRGVADEELIIRSLAAGSYTVEVFGFLSAENLYTVSSTILTCDEDDFEPNNSAAQSVPISAGAVSAVRCGQNDDFFRIRLEGGDALDARLTGAGLTLSLVSTTGTLLQGDAADGANRRLQASGLAAGSYVLRVTGTGLAGVGYTLTPTITPSPARCVDDGAEPNNASDTSFALDGSNLADGSYELTTLNMCEVNPLGDFFKIDVGANKSIRVFLDHALTADLDLEVSERRGTSSAYRSIARSVAFDGDLDAVSGVINAPTNLTVKVNGFGTLPAAGVPYSLGFEVGEPPNAACVDDKFDTFSGLNTDGDPRTFNNNSSDTLTSTGTVGVAPVDLTAPESLAQLRICPNNSDFFKVIVAPNQKLNVDVSYAHSFTHDIDLRVFDSTSATALSCSQCAGTDGTEHFDVTPTTQKTYFIEVFGFQGGENRYDLSVSN